MKLEHALNSMSMVDDDRRPSQWRSDLLLFVVLGLNLLLLLDYGLGLFG
jgi:hypothetical protein